MKAKRFNELVSRLGLRTQAEAADVLGIGLRSFVRYANGQAPVPVSVRRLLLMLVRHEPGIPPALEGW
jgi:hypothetical protein